MRDKLEKDRMTGPALFFAGALPTILYFYYKTIWLPVGLHFGNNFTGTVLKANKETDTLFGNEGYLGAIVLAGLFFLLLVKTEKLINSDQSLKDGTNENSYN